MSEGGKTSKIAAKYLVGCDGGTSAIRKQLDIKLAGEGNILQLRQALYRCDDLFERIAIGKGRHYHVADNQATQLIVQDSTRHFTLHSVVEKDEDMAAMFEKTVAMPVKYEMLYVGEWRQNLLVADRFQEGRVLLAGDAVHLMIPTGGLGMNTGVGDAIDLGWKLAGTLQGWGGPGLLASYEAERRPTGERNVGASRFASLGRRKWRAQWKPEIRDNTPEGAAARANLAAVADVEQRKTNEMTGAELGYHYAGSPLIAAEPGEPPYDLHRIRAEHVSRRAAAACVARRRPRRAGLHRRRLYAAAARRHDGRCLSARRGVPQIRRAVRGARSAGTGRARHLRIRPHPGAARPARGLARQRPARRSGATRCDGHGPLEPVETARADQPFLHLFLNFLRSLP